MQADLELLVSELVTNAVLHARSSARLTIERTGDRVRVTVADDSAERPRLRDYGADAVTGRGIFLVDQISETWGVDAADDGQDGKRVLVRDRDELCRESDRGAAFVNDSATYPIVLSGFPVALFLEARRHNEALVREFTFIVEAEAVPTDVPVRLLTLARQLRERFYGLNATLETQVDAAVAHGDEAIELQVRVAAFGREGALTLGAAVRRGRRVLPQRATSSPSPNPTTSTSSGRGTSRRSSGNSTVARPSHGRTGGRSGLRLDREQLGDAGDLEHARDAWRRVPEHEARTLGVEPLLRLHQQAEAGRVDEFERGHVDDHRIASLMREVDAARCASDAAVPNSSSPPTVTTAPRFAVLDGERDGRLPPPDPPWSRDRA